MATILRDALFKQGNHAVSNINSIWYRPLTNGAIASETMENGALVELDGRDADGNLKCKYYTGTGEFYILNSYAEDELLTDMGETDYKNFYIAKDEICNLAMYDKGLRQDTSLYILDSGVTLALDLPVEWDTTENKFKVVATSSNPVATVVGIDTDFGYNAGTETIRIQYK